MKRPIVTTDSTPVHAVVLYKRDKAASHGHIKIRCTVNRRSSYETLFPDAIPVELWDESRGRLRKTSAFDYIAMNERINERLGEIHKEATVKIKPNNRLTILELARRYNASKSVASTRSTYDGYLSSLERYLSDKGRINMSFQSLDVEALENIYNHFLSTVSVNHARNLIYYLKMVVRRAVKLQLVIYPLDMFIALDIRKEKPDPVALNAEELRTLITVPCKKPKNRKAQLTFLFQTFAGMRGGDLLLLRWSNIRLKESMLEYRMMKTGKLMRVFLNDNLKKILVELIEENTLFDEQVSNLTDSLRMFMFDQPAELAKIPRLLNGDLDVSGINLDMFSEAIQDDEFLRELILDLEGAIACSSIMRESALETCTNNRADEFIFPYLKQSVFPKEVTQLTASSKQYNQLRTDLNRYNTHIGKVCQELNIRECTSHAARHTLACLLSEDQTDLLTISKVLGHSDVLVTQRYLHNVTSTNMHRANDAIARRFRM